MSKVSIPIDFFNQIYSWVGQCTDTEATKKTAQMAIAFLRTAKTPEEWDYRIEKVMDEVRRASAVYDEDYAQILIKEIAKQQKFLKVDKM